MKRIYFDYAATTPTDPEVLKVMEPYFFEKFGNASSLHAFGRAAQKAFEDARQILADFIGAKPEEIIFNSGATEANNHAILGIARALSSKGNHLIVSAIEHHSVLEPVSYLQRQGFKITYLNVDQFGLVDPEEIKKAITPQTILVALIHASNEIGTIEPVREIGKITRERQIPFLVDAVQALGHMPVNVNALNADLLSLSAHKFYGPKGIGALYIRKGIKIPSLLLGGDQERSRRASTENVAGAVGLAKAIELCKIKMGEEILKQTKWRDQLLTEIPKHIEGVHVNGHREGRLSKNAHFSFESLDGEALLMALDMAGIAASMGSACASGAIEPSHVLRAIGLPDELALGSLRVTIGRWTTQEEIDYLLEKLPGIVSSLRV